MAGHLFILCGLPKRLSENACQVLQKEFNRVGSFIHLPAGATKPYYTEKYTQQAVDKLKDHIVEHHSPLPASLNILYAASMDSDMLRCRCFLFSRLIAYQPERIHDLQSCVDAAADAVLSLRDDKPDKHQFMPPLNFHVGLGRRARDVFESWALGTMSDEELRACFKEKDFNMEKLPVFLKGKKRKKFFVDVRGLVFPPCRPNEEHGNLSVDGTSDSFIYLSAFYRFGWLKGAGFHHDVQYPKSSLGKTSFACSRAGDVCCNGESHANIYLNDVVRLGLK